MPDKNIKIAVDKVNFYAGKFNTGYFDPQDIAREIHVESMNIFEKYYDEFAKTQKISDYLRPFKAQSDVDLTNGLGTVPTAQRSHRVLPRRVAPVGH